MRCRRHIASPNIYVTPAEAAAAAALNTAAGSALVDAAANRGVLSQAATLSAYTSRRTVDETALAHTRERHAHLTASIAATQLAAARAGAAADECERTVTQQATELQLRHTAVARLSVELDGVNRATERARGMAPVVEDDGPQRTELGRAQRSLVDVHVQLRESQSLWRREQSVLVETAEGAAAAGCALATLRGQAALQHAKRTRLDSAVLGAAEDSAALAVDAVRLRGAIARLGVMHAREAAVAVAAEVSYALYTHRMTLHLSSLPKRLPK